MLRALLEPRNRDTVTGDLLEEYDPGDPRGELRKIEDWFDFQDNGQTFTVNTRNDIGSQSAYLLRDHATSGAVDAKRYRWTFRPRATVWLWF